jgi:hypothetical protein
MNFNTVKLFKNQLMFRFQKIYILSFFFVIKAILFNSISFFKQYFTMYAFYLHRLIQNLLILPVNFNYDDDMNKILLYKYYFASKLNICPYNMMHVS